MAFPEGVASQKGCNYVWIVWMVGDVISWSGQTEDMKIGSCGSQCDITHQWIVQTQVGSVFYIVTGWGVMSYICGSTLVWQHKG